jgi:hypothetical protein
MQKVIYALVILAFLVSCEENLPPIDFSDSSDVKVDTVYQIMESEMPEQQDQTIVVEDLTGVRCNNCPKAADIAKQIKEDNPDRAVVIGIYPEEPRNLSFPYDGYEDLRTEVSQRIAADIYGFSNQLPGGGVNRKLFSGQTSINTSFNTWINFANQIMPNKSAVNIDLEVSSESDSLIELGSVFTFFESPENPVFLSIMLLENNISHPQTTTTGTDNAYVHQHVLRAMYTPHNGEPLLKQGDLAPERGVRVERSWEFIIPENVNKNEASLVVMLNYNAENNKEILQCKEIKLK